ncbi:MAG: efflux RND transporter periplasmic adaptor subunit [Sedimentisphaerales bacterium]|nr:efflux RND transporter periplasmic adaptor subunit [Sedimentisphaerales bacterium]
MKKGIAILVILAVALAAAAGYRIHQRHSQVAAQSIDELQLEAGVPVRVFTIQPVELKKTVSLSGGIEPYQSVAIAPTLSERIETIHVQTGQAVAAGALLVTLDAVQAKLAVDQARASLAAAQEQVNKLEEGSRPEEIQAARARLAEADAQLKLQELETKRYQGLYEEQAATLQQLQSVENQYTRLQAAGQAAQAQLDLLLAGARREDIAMARSQRDLARVALEQAQERLDDHYLRAPFAGVVTMRHLEPGSIVDFNQTIFSLLQIDPIYLVLPVSELYIPHIAVGMPVEITVDALPDERFTGQVAQIDPLGTSDRSFKTKIRLDNPRGSLQAGMFGRAHIIVERIEQALAVPADAIRQEDQSRYVYVAETENGTTLCRRKDIQVGAVFDRQVHVPSGLQAGDRVITLAQSFLEPGTKVVITEEQAP